MVASANEGLRPTLQSDCLWARVHESLAACERLAVLREEW